MVLSDYIWKDYTYTVRITGSYSVFYQGVPIDHCTHVPDPVYQYSAGSELNTASTAGLALSQFRMIKNELMNKDPYVVLEQSHIIIYGIEKSALCITQNGKDTKQTRHISRRMHFVINGNIAI